MRNILLISLNLLLLTGCAGSLDRPEYQTSRQPSTASSEQNKNIKCNAGEILICETRSPHRVSDGRYGWKNKRSKKCYCQQESDFIDNMKIDTLGNGQ
ncbi:MAG: hypothetical protein CMP03_03860 [Woeseiaceae bacterium]|nr:hypothetical protein [Woeseiaceae bacterium]